MRSSPPTQNQNPSRYLVDRLPVPVQTTIAPPVPGWMLYLAATLAGQSRWGIPMMGQPFIIHQAPDSGCQFSSQPSTGHCRACLIGVRTVPRALWGNRFREIIRKLRPTAVRFENPIGGSSERARMCVYGSRLDGLPRDSETILLCWFCWSSCCDDYKGSVAITQDLLTNDVLWGGGQRCLFVESSDHLAEDERTGRGTRTASWEVYREHDN